MRRILFGLMVCLAVAAAADTVVLGDGTVIQGKILLETDELVVIESATLGRQEFSREQVLEIRYRKSARYHLDDPAYNAVMFSPTPSTIGKGDWFFRDFELFVLNFGYGLTDRISLGAITLFPFQGALDMLSVGAKWMILDREVKPVGLALAASATFMDGTQSGQLSLIAGAGNRNQSINASLVQGFGDGDGGIYLAVGGDYRLSQRFKILCEYFNATPLMEDEQEFYGFINIGLRFIGERLSVAMTGFRPLYFDRSDNLVAFPMVAFSYHW